MSKLSDKIKGQKLRRHLRVRSKLSGTAKRPRLSVFRSNRGLYLQLVDDSKGSTLVSAHAKELKSKGNKVELASALGKLLAEKAQKAGIKEIVFDRGAYRYHGRIKAVADAAREQDLVF